MGGGRLAFVEEGEGIQVNRRLAANRFVVDFGNVLMPLGMLVDVRRREHWQTWHRITNAILVALARWWRWGP